VDNIKTDLQDTGWQTWIGLIWLRTRSCGRLLQKWWNFGFDKMWRVCQVAKELTSFSRQPLTHEPKQSVSWLPTIRHLNSLPCIYWRSPVPVYTQVLFLCTHKSCSCVHTSPVPVYTQVLFLCIHKHTTLTMLSSIMQNISSSLCTTILELWLPGAAESSVSVTKWLTITWHSSRLLISVSERKHTDHIHGIKHAHYTQ